MHSSGAEWKADTVSGERSSMQAKRLQRECAQCCTFGAWPSPHSIRKYGGGTSAGHSEAWDYKRTGIAGG